MDDRQAKMLERIRQKAEGEGRECLIKVYVNYKMTIRLRRRTCRREWHVALAYFLKKKSLCPCCDRAYIASSRHKKPNIIFGKLRSRR